MPASQNAWTVWFGAWFASHWSSDDLPSIRQMIRLYDQVERGEFQRASELRLWLDTLGVSPKGQQDRRWAPPKPDEAERSAISEPAQSRYGHLRAVGTG